MYTILNTFKYILQRSSWFFSNQKANILRKKTKNFTREHMIEVFTEKENKSGL